VPETPDGQVLALVDKPGAPAELVTVPEAGDAPTSQQPADDTVAQASEGTADGETTPTAAQENENAQAAQQQAAASDEDAPAPNEAAETAADTPAGQQGDQLAAETDTPAGDAETRNDAAASATGETPADAGQQVASAPEARNAPEPSAEPQVVVEAVEIEGGTVFVAGSANPGSTVRVYANDILLGDARASEAGRFLVEARRELPVGNYMIRADVLDASGAVLARAAVPFEREPGEAIAAVAPSATAPADQQDSGQDEAALAEAPAATAEPEAQPTGQAPATQPDISAASTEQATANDDGPADETIAAADTGNASNATGADTGSEATAPALQRAEGSVIIRRGDSLWRISRRVYGRGV